MKDASRLIIPIITALAVQFILGFLAYRIEQKRSKEFMNNLKAEHKVKEIK